MSSLGESSARSSISRIRESKVILPSLLLCDFGNLEREAARLEAAGVQAFHLDVMDGTFVPNFTYGMTIVAAMRRLTKLPLDVHLMMVHPERYVAQFRDAGADLLTFHVEAVDAPAKLIDAIHASGMAAGIALNPGTPLAPYEGLLGSVELFLAMSVDAGFGGQKFNPVALEKLRAARRLGGERLILEVDGGVNAGTIAACADAGANWFVVGSAIFGQSDYGEAIERLGALANRGA